ncbi:MAG: trimethylamine methyltransferase family protein [Deltaproteobacteria bacterium]|nr:trimethylamine methyltransferase family protein [Deltaproteobacteria bacterium]
MSDSQLGHEKTLTGLIAALAGANLIYGPGMLESGITFDFAQLVLDNEFAGMIKQTVRGFIVDDESLAVDVIKSVGPSKDFLAQEHTLKHMRTHSRPELIDRSGMEMWQASGATDSYQRALEKTRDILQHHQPDPLPDKVLADIRSIVTETGGELGA